MFQRFAVLAYRTDELLLKGPTSLLLEKTQRRHTVEIGLMSRQANAAFRHPMSSEQVMQGKVVVLEVRAQPIVQVLQRIDPGQHGGSEPFGGDFPFFADSLVIRRFRPFRPFDERASHVIGEWQ